MKKKYKVLLRIVFILILVFLIVLVCFKLAPKSKTNNYEVVDKISEFNYTLDDRDTKLMKNEFNKLKDILKSKEIDYSSYAKSISNLFIIDLFTIKNKESKYDVGGLEYVYPEVASNFKLNVEDTLYKYISFEGDIEYPIVSEIISNEIEDTTYTYDEVEYPAYKVLIKWNYEKDLGYYKEGKVTLIKDNNKIYVVAFKGVEEN